MTAIAVVGDPSAVVALRTSGSAVVPDSILCLHLNEMALKVAQDRFGFPKRESQCHWRGAGIEAVLAEMHLMEVDNAIRTRQLNHNPPPHPAPPILDQIG